MGTRHNICVYSSGDLKLSQYGQWDGDPSGQGVIILSFLRDKLDAEKFLNNLNKAYEPKTDGECEKLFNKPATKPFVSRDTSAQILPMIQDFKGKKFPLVLGDSFLADSLFCEWAYVIDFDANEFQVYKGFNKNPLQLSDRYFYLEDKAEDGYHPVKLSKTYKLDALPSNDDFLKAFAKKEKE